MLSIKSLGLAGAPGKNGASGSLAAYFEHLSIEGYYQDGGEPPGVWHGKLAAAFGLAGNVRPGQLQKLFEGCHPDTGDALASNAGAEHKAGWDCTFSAPKSVSVAWALADPEQQQQIAQAHDDAVKAALAYLEQQAFSSRDRQGDSPLQGIIAATFQHSTSRELDPQLHTHCAIANLGLRKDGRVCALDLDTRVKMTCGALYRADLAHRLQALGYTVERDGKSFKLSAVPDDLCKLFSKRRQQIENYLDEQGFDSAKAANIAALATRKAKVSPSRQSLQAQWQHEADAAGYVREALQQRLRADPDLDSKPPALEPLDLAVIVTGLTQNESFFTRQQLEAAIAVECQGICGAAEILTKIERAIREGLANPAWDGLVRLSEPNDQQKSRRKIEIYTTREMLELEQLALAAAVEKSQSRNDAVSLQEKWLEGLSAEQAAAVQHITQPSGLCCVKGLAGTGKSHMLGVARIAWESQGYEVIGAALAGKAADGLESGSGIPSQTLHALLAELDSGRRVLTDKTVVVIDECGMVGTRQMARLIAHAQSGGKIVLCGDERQLQSIEAGGLFKGIAERIGYAGLTEIRRQRAEADRETIKTLISGEAEAVIQLLEDAGQLRFEKDDQVAEQMVEDWLAHRDPLNPAESLMLASTRAEVRTLNRIARSKLIATGELHSEVSIPTAEGERSFCVGERICFLRNSRALGVKNGQLGTLESWAMDMRSGKLNLSVRMDGGAVVSFDPAQYGHLESGFGLSVHKAQGVTANCVSVLLMNDQMVDQQLSYVAISRHRERLRVFVPNSMQDELGRGLARSREKGLASDLAAERMRKVKGLERG